MNKQDVIEFFDRLAPQWDADMIRDDAKIDAILDYGGITEGVSVLDVACGTGVLFPDYLARNVKEIMGVDISPAMIEIAKSKFDDPRVKVVAADIEDIVFPELYDRCMVYNAFPHFPDPTRLVENLARKLILGGRLTVAHGMSRAKLAEHHSGSATKVSIDLVSEKELALLFEPFFAVDVALSNDEVYVVSGTKR